MQHSPNMPGSSSPDEPSVRAETPRPLSMHWISDDLLQATIAAWSPRYGRTITTDEAIEILMNVKRFSESLISMVQERRDDE